MSSASVAWVTLGNSLPSLSQEPHGALPLRSGLLGLRRVMRHWGSLLTGWPFVGILCHTQGKDWATAGSLGSGPSRPGQRVWGLKGPLEATSVEQFHAVGPSQHRGPRLTGSKSWGTLPGEWEQFQGILGRRPQPRNCSTMQMHHVLNGEK